MRVVAVQSVFYNPTPAELARFCQCLLRLRVPEGWQLEILTGNCGDPIEWPIERPGHWQHVEFGANLGFGQGHNQLFREHSAECVWILNPDTAFLTDALANLLLFADDRPDWGMVELRLSPLEHPKAVDPQTLESSWCSGCAVLAKSTLYRQVGGFDEAFFLYSEDVDLSWRMRAGGGRLYCCPNVAVYHSRLGEPSETERFWATVSDLLLLKKYARKLHLINRISDLASQADADKIFAEVLRRLPSLTLATAGEVRAASWTGRLNAPLRFDPGPLPANPSGSPKSLRIKPGEPNLHLESALSAWATGIPEIDATDPDGRLPFEPSATHDCTEIDAGQLLFPGGTQGQSWARARVVQTYEGWLTQSITLAPDPLKGVQVEFTDEPLELRHDPDNWRLIARSIRSKLRILRLPKSLRSMAKEIILG